MPDLEASARATSPRHRPPPCVPATGQGSTLWGGLGWGRHSAPRGPSGQSAPIQGSPAPRRPCRVPGGGTPRGRSQALSLRAGGGASCLLPELPPSHLCQTPSCLPHLRLLFWGSPRRRRRLAHLENSIHIPVWLPLFRGDTSGRGLAVVTPDALVGCDSALGTRKRSSKDLLALIHVTGSLRGCFLDRAGTEAHLIASTGMEVSTADPTAPCGSRTMSRFC